MMNQDMLLEALNDALQVIDHRYAQIVRCISNQTNKRSIFSDNQLIEQLLDKDNVQLQMAALAETAQSSSKTKADMLPYIMQALRRGQDEKVKLSYMAFLSIQMRRRLKNESLWPQFQEFCIEQLNRSSQMLTAFSLICLRYGWKYVQRKPATYLKIDFDNYYQPHWPPQIQSKFILASLQYSTRFGQPAQLQKELQFALKVVSNVPVSSTINSLIDAITQFADKLSQEFFAQLQQNPLIMEFKDFQPQSLRRLMCFMLQMVERKSQISYQIAFTLLHKLNNRIQFIDEDFKMVEYTIEAFQNLAVSKQNCERLFKNKNIIDSIFHKFSQNLIFFEFQVCKLCGKFLTFWPSQILLQYFQDRRIIRKIYQIVQNYLVSYQDRELFFLDQVLRTLQATVGFEVLWRPDVERLALLMSIDVAIEEIKSGILLETKRKNLLTEAQIASKDIISNRLKKFHELGKQTEQILSLVKQADLRLSEQRLLDQQVQPEFLFPSLILDQPENSWLCYFVSIAFRKNIRNSQLLMTSHHQSKSIQVQIGKAYPLILLLKTDNCIIACIAATSEPGKDEQAYFCFLKKKQFFRLKQGKRAVIFDKENFIFGNQDVRITRNSGEIKSTFGTKDSFFSTESRLRKDIGVFSHPQSTAKFISYEIFTVSFD